MSRPASATSLTGQAAAPAPPAPPGSKLDGYHVLLLYEESRLTQMMMSADEALRATLTARSPVPAYFYTEFLDLNLVDDVTSSDERRELLRRKYESRHIDVIVAVGPLAVPIALQCRADLSSTPPVVFVGMDRATAASLDPGAAATGTWLHVGWAETLDLARRLHPGTRRAAVVIGSTPAERILAKMAHEQLAASAGSMEVRYLVDRSLEDVVEEIAALPKDTIVLAGSFLRDGTGRDFMTTAVISRISAVSSVPVYGITEGSLGAGAVGGYLLTGAAHGKVAADLALRVLAGERPSPTDAGTTVPMFDDRQLGRWRIDRRLLPPGSVVRFHEPSMWERYQGYLIGAVSLIVLQSALIGLLLAQRAQRRRAQQGLAERLRFETLLSNLSTALASCRSAEIDREIEAALRRIVEDLGTDRATLWSLDARSGEVRATHSWARAGVPAMAAVISANWFPWIAARIREAEVCRLPSPEGLPAEASVDRENLAEIGMRSAAVAPLVESGVVIGGLFICMVLAERRWPDELLPRLRLLADIFAGALARQRAEAAAHESARDIRDLAGRLMTAEEDERRRIARELHDGVNQDLAALSIALSALEHGLPEDTPADQRQEITALQARAVALTEAVRHLSHELHPGILQYAGLAAALRSHCLEVERSHDLPVVIRADEDLGALPADVALCLYRVTQEALRNAVTHAKAGHVWVTVTREGTDLVLTINDDGIGFDLAAAHGLGLGLISLEERVRLVGGRLGIDTRPEQGTEIRVVVPLG